MAWISNLRESAYTSPGGTRLTFDYEVATEEFEQKGGTFELVDANATYVQSLGVTGRRYPMKIIIHGDTYDESASQWMNVLSESGQGTLEHPVYGRKVVIPSGKVKRTENLVNGAGQAIIEVTFFETTGSAYPSSKADATTTIASQSELANDAQAKELSDSGVASQSAASVASISRTTRDATSRRQFLDSSVDNINFVYTKLSEAIDELNDVVDSYTDQSIIGEYQKAKRLLDQIKSSIDLSIINIVDQPISFANQVQQLVASPGNLIINANSNIEKYMVLFKQMTGSITRDGTVKPDIEDLSYLNSPFANPVANAGTRKKPDIVVATNLSDFQSRSLLAGSLAIVAAKASVNTAFKSQNDALSAAESILSMLDELSVFRDESENALGIIDEGGAWQAIERCLAMASGFIIEISLGLSRERSITISKRTTIINVASKIFGAVDDRLDELINYNELTGDEILELPRGKEIVYFE